MSGWQQICRIESIAGRCDALGMKIGQPRFSPEVYISVYPKDDESLPIYTRDAVLFTGTLDSLANWLEGVEWARNYDRMIFDKRFPSRREKREQYWRHRNLMKKLVDD